MADVLLPDTSPVIYLARAELLHLLWTLAPDALIVSTVAHEIRMRPATDPAVAALADEPRLRIAQSPPIPDGVRAANLGPGESAVLALALVTPNAIVLIDDRAGRGHAQRLGLAVRGTVGMVLSAKRDGAIPLARPILIRLRAAGMYLSDRVMNEALSRVNE